MRLRWEMDGELEAAMATMFACVERFLRPGGVFLIHANGARNSEAADALLSRLGAARGLQEVVQEPALHKWRKPGQGEGSRIHGQ